MNYETKEEILGALSFSARYFRDLFPLDCAVAVTDGEKFLAVYPGKKIDPGGRAGDTIPSDDVDPQVMRTGKAVSAESPAEVYGFAFKATVIPIRDTDLCSKDLCICKLYGYSVYIAEDTFV